MFNRKHALLGAVVAGAVTLSASLGFAGIVNPVIDFGPPSFAKEGTRLANDHTSTGGDVMTIVGKVVLFQEPFDDLDANDPTKEYTYRITGLVSSGTVSTGAVPYQFFDTDYTGGTFEVYCDPAKDANHNNEASFVNGTMIISGSFSSFHTNTNIIFGGGCGGDQFGEFQFTGGTLFSRVSDNGVGFTGINQGGFAVCSAVATQSGYFGWSDSKLDVNPPLPVESSTWGRIKDMYQD